MRLPTSRWWSSEAGWVPWWCRARGEEEGIELAAVGFLGGEIG